MQANINTSRKGAMYLRKSQADLEKERIGKYETLVKHETELNDLAKYMELPVDDTYKELVSGESIGARLEFQKLMDGVQARKYGYVICHAVDRLGRGDMMEYGWVLSTFRYTNTLIVTPGKTYNPADPYDYQQLQLQMFFSNTEYEKIKERFASGKLASSRSGQYIGSVRPYGYDKTVTPDKKKTLKKNEKEADIVVRMYEDAARGKSKSAIATELRTSGIPSPQGGEWHPNYVKRLIQNPIYKGYIRWGYRKTVVAGREGMNLNKTRGRDENCDCFKGLHEPIVSEELWQAANDAIIVNNDPRLKIKHELLNPLAGILRCAKCGRSMHVRTARGRSYYNHQYHSSCSMRGARMERIVEAVARQLEELAEGYMIEADNTDREVAEHELRLRSITREIEDVERRKSKLVELYSAEAIDISEFRDRRAPLDERAELLAAALEKEKEYTPKPAQEVASTLSGAVSLLCDDSISAQEKNDALKQVVERIDYLRDGEEVKLTIYLR